ncbi:MAG: formamidopyrimidine-DNA glycosylase [Acidimicrobiales bacterium]|nr:formamidopyrimidine-DNA glycosylase [Acidimicrobiales bacterium]
MPEGHTIHRLARDQRRDLVGAPLGASSAQERFVGGAARLDGQVLRRVEPWGKHLFQWYESGDVLHVHLGLIGKWQRRPSPPPLAVGEMRLRLEGPERTWDLSGPMVCRIVTPDDRDAVVARLGPDPLRPDADPDRMWSRLQRSDKPVGILLMEQDVVAGIGNVYRSELLNIVGIDPRRAGRAVTRDEFDALWAETVRQLRLGVRRNKIVTMSPAELGRPISRLARGAGRYAYKQEACGRCGTPLDVFPLAGRRTWACRACQPR